MSYAQMSLSATPPPLRALRPVRSELRARRTRFGRASLSTSIDTRAMWLPVQWVATWKVSADFNSRVPHRAPLSWPVPWIGCNSVFSTRCGCTCRVWAIGKIITPGCAVRLVSLGRHLTSIRISRNFQRLAATFYCSVITK